MADDGASTHKTALALALEKALATVETLEASVYGDPSVELQMAFKDLALKRPAAATAAAQLANIEEEEDDDDDLAVIWSMAVATALEEEEEEEKESKDYGPDPSSQQPNKSRTSIRTRTVT